MIKFFNRILFRFGLYITNINSEMTNCVQSIPTVHNGKVIQLLDIQFDLRLVNLAVIAETSGFSHQYTRRLIYGEKKNIDALWKVRNAILKHYEAPIKFVPYKLKTKPSRLEL